LWEGCTSHLLTADDLTKFTEDQFALQFASIENHYFFNRGFFPRDGFLLEPEQLAKIRGIPTTIVQGRYDVVCPFETAWLLSKGLPEADFIVSPSSGHSQFEPENARALVAAAEKYATLK
jgi:proline iminopeptidase